MSFRLERKAAVDTATLILSTTNITTSAWVTVFASTKKGCTAFEITNPSNSTLMIAVGSAGNEVAIPYTVPPGIAANIIMQEISGKVRISLKAVDTTAATGTLIMNLYG